MGELSMLEHRSVHVYTLVRYLLSCSELISYRLFHSDTFGVGTSKRDTQATRAWIIRGTSRALVIKF